MWVDFQFTSSIVCCSNRRPLHRTGSIDLAHIFLDISLSFSLLYLKRCQSQVNNYYWSKCSSWKCLPFYVWCIFLQKTLVRCVLFQIKTEIYYFLQNLFYMGLHFPKSCTMTLYQIRPSIIEYGIYFEYIYVWNCNMLTWIFMYWLS